MVAALRELDTGVLINQGFVQLAECLIFLSDLPRLLVIKADLNEIFGVGPVVIWILHNFSIVDFTIKPHLEEMGSTEIINILRAILGMV